MEVTTQAFSRPEKFDVVAHMQQTLAEAVFGRLCEVILDLSIEEARHRISPVDGTLEVIDGGTRFRFDADDLDWAAGYLAHLECDLTVVSPPELRVSLRRIAERLQRAARRSKRI
jgi:predicted DNA-binding transcriptional regulator YafY